MAPPVLALLRVSRYLPTVTSDKIMPALSKYRLFMTHSCAMWWSPAATAMLTW